MSFRSVLILIAFLFATQVSSQKMLLLENKNNLKNYKYFAGEHIRFRIGEEKKWRSGDISILNDTALIVNWIEEVPLVKITAIARRQWLFSILSRLSITAGVFYFSLDSFNNLINANNPVIDQQTAIISASLIAGGFLLQPLIYRKIKIGDEWSLRVLDLGNP